MLPIALACALSLALIVVPLLSFGAEAPPIAVLVAVSAAALVGTVSTGILYLAFVPILIPSTVYQDTLLLPGGFKFAEGLFLVLLGLWLVTAMSGRSPRVRTPLDRPLVVFLLLVAGSCVLGFLYGQSTSQMLRDVRYPFYYSVFFLATRHLPPPWARTICGMAIAAAAVVSVEYLVEFVGTIEDSISGAFYRVARVEGLMLPIGTLLITAVWLFERRATWRLLSGLALIPVGLAFVITVGRGMWIAAIAGLAILGVLLVVDRNRAGRRWIVLAAVPVVILGSAYSFQQVTSAGVGTTAFRRIGRIQNYEEDHSISGRLLSYGVALDAIFQRPVFGGGHGVTVSYLVTNVEIPHVYKGGTVDSVYLTLLLRMGLVGLIAFLFLYVKAVLLAFRLFRTSRDATVRLFSAGFVSVYFALLVYGVADATLMTNRLILMHAVMLAMIGRMASAEGARADAEREAA